MIESKSETTTVKFQIYKSRTADVIPELGRLAGTGIIVPNSIQLLEDETENQSDLNEIISQKPEFNPNLVDYIFDVEERKTIAVITEEKLTAYAIEFELADKANCSRLMTSLHVYGKRELGKHYKFMYDDTQTRRFYIRADMLSELNRKLKNGEVNVVHLGVRLKKLLTDLETALLSNDQLENQ